MNQEWIKTLYDRYVELYGDPDDEPTLTPATRQR